MSKRNFDRPLQIEGVLVEAPKVAGMYQDCVPAKVLVNAETRHVDSDAKPDRAHVRFATY